MKDDRFKVGEKRWGWWDVEAGKLAWQCWVFPKEEMAIRHKPEEMDLLVVAAVYDGEKWVRLEDAPKALQKIAKVAA